MSMIAMRMQMHLDLAQYHTKQAALLKAELSNELVTNTLPKAG